MAVRVRGWEKANAALERGGYGLSHDPTRKRADFPAVSRHENHEGIGREGVANVGGCISLVLPSPSLSERASCPWTLSMELSRASTNVYYRAASRFYDC